MRLLNESLSLILLLFLTACLWVWKGPLAVVLAALGLIGILLLMVAGMRLKDRLSKR